MKRVERWLVAASAVFLLAACVARVPVPEVPSPDGQAALAAWSRVLHEFVDGNGSVDFPRLALHHRDLDSYVRHVADLPLESIPEGDGRLAHMINAYNALSMYNVLHSGIPLTHAGWNKIRFFVLRRVEVGGRSMSLYSFENDVIRPYARARADPRIHFALNCSAVACPVLPRTPFSANNLDAELEREAHAFFARTINFRLDASDRTVWLSEMLDFYTEDFVPLASTSLAAYASRYAPLPVPDGYSVRFTPYDWTVANSQRSR